jgi:N utilization substance protein B
MSLRRRGREIALQILYQSEWGTIEDVDAAIKEYVTGLFPELSSEAESVLAFAKSRLQGVLDHKEELDAILKKCAKRWRLDRMPRVDRNIMRLGAFELCHCSDIPPGVAINEAVELAKTFGGEESGAFVNGILDAVLRVRQEAER